MTDQRGSIDNLAVIEATFQPIYGLPCWNAKAGYGSFLTMEFGEPHLVIREPRSRPDSSPRLQRLLARRLVTVRGEWHLWIYCCEWQVESGGRVIGDSSSTRRFRMRFALSTVSALST